MKQLSTIVLLCLSAFGQTTYSNPARYSGAVSYGNVPQQLSQGENVYCTAGAGTEKIEGTPTWGAADGVAQLPARCINTAVASTPSPGATINVAANDSTGFTSALASVQCGQTIQLTANSSYTAPNGGFVFPALSCDGAHWITIKSSGVSDANFPAEGVRATPCIAGISNDATNGYNAPGYPSYSCPSYPAVLTAKLLTNTTNQPAIQMASGANHYRFIGIEITKQAEVKPGQLVSMTTDGGTQGANHVIFDRVVLHGQPWTMASTSNAETQAGINVNNTQWFAFINSWNYDTYCNGGCVDSQAIGGGTGAYASGPFKVYNNLLATSGESLIFGGGGQGIGTPNPQDLEARANHSFKPLVWMIPIEACGAVNQVVPKNLGEFKNMVSALLEGNVFENSWQGCQSDQTGFAFLLSPKNQNNKASIVVNFDGSATATRVSGGNFIHSCGNNPSCSPADAANCPPGGCILEVGGVDYRFCNGSNGCAQAGDLTTTATLTTTVPAASGVAATTCVPGDCPSCKVQT